MLHEQNQRNLQPSTESNIFRHVISRDGKLILRQQMEKGVQIVPINEKKRKTSPSPWENLGISKNEYCKKRKKENLNIISTEDFCLFQFDSIAEMRSLAVMKRKHPERKYAIFFFVLEFLKP